MYENPLMKKKIFLFVTEFLCGIALMGVETAANRLLAPYFSSSQVVWTIIIGAILIAMSIGNYLGGRLADKYKDVTLLYTLMLAAGAYICLIPFVGRYVIAGVSAIFALIVNSGLIIWSTIFVCLILFVPPLIILGMVTPSLIKYTMGQQASGRIVGILEALNTVGSIIGTFIPIFITIPTMGTSYTFALFGGLICLISIIFILTGFIHNNKMRKQEALANKEEGTEKQEKTKISLAKCVLSLVSSTFAIAGIVLASFSNFVFWNDKQVIYEDESIYNYLQVKEDSNAYYFSTNVLFSVQSMIKKDMSLTGMYYDYCLSAAYMANIDKKADFSVLVLGNGTGTYATLLKEYMPYDTDIVGVEIDQKIIDLSYKYFMMPDDIHVVCDDGRNYLNLNKEKYDLIMVDAYSSISTPFAMSTVEFFTSVKEHLKDDGVMVMNINMYDTKAYSLDIALCDTVSGCFSNVYKYKVPNGASGDEVFASDNPEIINNLKNGISICEKPSLRYAMEKVLNDYTQHIDSGIRLYDDNSDVELRSMNSIDGLIEESLAFYRRIYEERGLMGLIEYLLS